MMIYIIIAVVAFIIYAVVQQNKLKKRVQDPEQWERLVKEHRLTADKQKVICLKYKVMRPIITEIDCE
ncbi:MAG: hypothetical protein ACJAT7_001746 [Psychromonas sp.]|jgi:hypothetical protein|uniref:hypothetical protein n=1 Tax=Psychromonas sp. TaxID=1884585 RepID=UPI0039E6E406